MTLPAPLLVSVTLDTVLSVMSQYLIDVTQVELMESSCGSRLWDIKPKSFSLVWPVLRLSAVCVWSVCFRAEWSTSKEPAGGKELAIVCLLFRRLMLCECTSVFPMGPSQCQRRDVWSSSPWASLSYMNTQIHTYVLFKSERFLCCAKSKTPLLCYFKCS